MISKKNKYIQLQNCSSVTLRLFQLQSGDATLTPSGALLEHHI